MRVQVTRIGVMTPSAGCSPKTSKSDSQTSAYGDANAPMSAAVLSSRRHTTPAVRSRLLCVLNEIFSPAQQQWWGCGATGVVRSCSGLETAPNSPSSFFVASHQTAGSKCVPEQHLGLFAPHVSYLQGSTNGPVELNGVDYSV